MFVSAILVSLSTIAVWWSVTSLQRSAARLRELSLTPTLEAAAELESALATLANTTESFGKFDNGDPCST
ncbi:MAG: hypothetical protein KDB26_10820 [Microthrixaceae bacterium]|nr:hypothetical protein [Microthrixaceae bacterium]